MNKEDYHQLAAVADDVIAMCEKNRWANLSLDRDYFGKEYGLDSKLSRTVELVGNRALKFSRVSEALCEDLGSSDEQRKASLERMLGINFSSMPQVTISSHINVAMCEADLESTRSSFGFEGKPILGFIYKELPHFSFTDIRSRSAIRHEAQHIRNPFLMPEIFLKPKGGLQQMTGIFKDELVAQLTDPRTHDELVQSLVSSKGHYDFIREFIEAYVNHAKDEAKKALEDLLSSAVEKPIWREFVSFWGIEDQEVELLGKLKKAGELAFLRDLIRLTIEKKLVETETFKNFAKMSHLMIQAATRIQSETSDDVTTLLAVTPVRDWGKLLKD